MALIAVTQTLENKSLQMWRTLTKMIQKLLEISVLLVLLTFQKYNFGIAVWGTVETTFSKSGS